MRVLMNYVSSREAGGPLRAAIVAAEPALAALFENLSLGDCVDEVVLVGIAVHDDPESNSRFLKQNDGLVRYRDRSGVLVTALQIAVCLPATEVAEADPAKVQADFFAEIVGRIDSGGVVCPEGFDLRTFAEVLRRWQSKSPVSRH